MSRDTTSSCSAYSKPGLVCNMFESFSLSVKDKFDYFPLSVKDDETVQTENTSINTYTAAASDDESTNCSENSKLGLSCICNMFEYALTLNLITASCRNDSKPGLITDCDASTGASMINTAENYITRAIQGGPMGTSSPSIEDKRDTATKDNFGYRSLSGKGDETVQTENMSIHSTTLLKSTSVPISITFESVNIINQDPNQQYFEI